MTSSEQARAPQVGIVGRTNVGKSTLFNRLVGGRPAIVHDLHGVTRDRKVGICSKRERSFELVDTGGLAPGTQGDELAVLTADQARRAIQVVDLLVFVVDVKDGLTPGDELIAEELRRSGQQVLLVVNKVDSSKREELVGEFFGLGMGEPVVISAEHGLGMDELLEAILERLPEGEVLQEESGIRVAVVGRPNVGKSSLVNALLGEERAMVSEIPGTTRDAVDTLLLVGESRYTLVDTAGVRRKGKTKAQLERYCVMMALRSLERCDVVLLLIDGEEGPTDQDAHIAGYVLEAGRACVVLVNKMDQVARGRARGELIRRCKEKIHHLGFAQFLPVSARTRRGLAKILPAVDQANEQYRRRIKTSDLNQVMEEAQLRHPPPVNRRGRPQRVTYSVQVTTAPPTFVLFSSRPAELHFTYRRYLQNRIREAYGFAGTPIRLLFKVKSMRRKRKEER